MSSSMRPENSTKLIAEKGKQDLFIIREFDASRELVFKAFSDPDILSQFFVPPGAIMTFSSREFRTGGQYRYTHTDKEGRILCTFNGVIHLLKSPEIIVQTAELEGLPGLGNVLLEKMLFEDLPMGRTLLTIHDICFSEEARDMMIQSGMESGLVMIFNQLDELLKKN